MEYAIEISKKERANDLAAAIFKKDNMPLDADFFNDLDKPSGNKQEEVPQALSGDRVGIWEKRNVNGKEIYERDLMFKPEWEFWSNTHQIDIDSESTRIVYLGESAARGMFYDPLYCPAKLLENILNLNDAATKEYEVVDLARTNMDYAMLKDITLQVPKLNPDMLVIFAGNNWIFTVQRILASKGLSIENFDPQSWQQLVNKEFREVAQEYLEILDKLSVGFDIPVYFMLPEFNLGDWSSSEQERIPSNIMGQDLNRWVELRELIERGTNQGTSLDHAREMAELDSTNPFPFETMGSINLKNGNIDAARENFEKAKNTNVFGRSSSKPRTHSALFDVFRNAESNVRIIDLPKLFVQKDKFPNQELFLDYCHLTEQGITMSISALAANILEQMRGEKVNADDLEITYEPTNDVRANALINAAIHNAHYGQSTEVLTSMCSKAAKLSEDSQQFMKEYIDMASRKASTTICGSHEVIVENGFSEQYGSTGILHKPNQKLMDVQLVDAMTAALTPYEPNLESQVEKLRIDSFGLGEGKVNLLDSAFSRISYEEFPGQQVDFFQARNNKSEFLFVLDAPQEINLKITQRTPGLNLENKLISVILNNETVSQFNSNKSWKTNAITIPAELCKKGINRIKVEWPIEAVYEPEKGSDEFVDPNKQLDNWYIVFGEIHQLTISKKS